MRYGFLALLLAACATPQQKAEQAIARQAQYCERLGYQARTDGWRRCIEEREKARNASVICTQVYGSTICN